MGTIIETGHIHNGSHIIVYHGVGRIHTLCYRTSGIFTMANILQHTREFRTVTAAPLIRYFITCTPHHNTWVITIVTNQIRQILIHPFIKYFMISIGHLCRFPFVKGFRHHHHTHLVTSLHQFGSRHIMRSTDCITAHIFQNTNLTTDSGIIYSTSQRAQVMMVTYSFEFGQFSIQKETLVGDNLQGTDTKTSGIFVFQGIPFIYFGFSRIKNRSFRTP